MPRNDPANNASITQSKLKLAFKDDTRNESATIWNGAERLKWMRRNRNKQKESNETRKQYLLSLFGRVLFYLMIERFN